MARRATKLDEDADFRSPAQNRERQRADAAEQVACSTFSGERMLKTPAQNRRASGRGAGC